MQNTDLIFISLVFVWIFKGVPKKENTVFSNARTVFICRCSARRGIAAASTILIFVDGFAELVVHELHNTELLGTYWYSVYYNTKQLQIKSL